MLHQRGLVSACLFEGWAKNEEEAVKLIRSGKLKIMSALDTNTVGAGTGIITKSVAMIVIEDRRTGIRGSNISQKGHIREDFADGAVLEIAENLRFMREELFPVLRKCFRNMGQFQLNRFLQKAIDGETKIIQRQTAADLLFEHQVLPKLIKIDIQKKNYCR